MSDINEQAAEKRKLIVNTNNLKASNDYRQSDIFEQKKQLPAEKPKTEEIKPVVKYQPDEPTFWDEVKKAVFGTSKIKNVPKHMLLKVFIPAMKQTFYDMFCGSLGIMFDVDGSSRRRRDRDRGYGGYYKGPSEDDDDDDEDERCPRSYREIGFRSKDEANDVYNEMIRIVDRKGYVTVLDFYGISDRKSPTARRDDHKGWYKEDLKHPDIYKKAGTGRWFIDLPRPQPIDD